VVAAITGCGRTDRDRSSPVEASSPGPSLAPPPPSPGEGTLRKIDARADVPLRGWRVDAKPGDWMITNGGMVAVVEGTGGRLVDFAAQDHDDALVAIEPVAYLGLDDLPSNVLSVGPAPEMRAVLRIEREVRGLPLRLWTFVSFGGPTLRIESIATSTGLRVLTTVGEIVSWGNVATWVQGSGFVTAGGSYSGDFLAREGLGVAYAMAREGARTTARFNAPSSGFHERAHTGEQTVIIPAGGSSPTRAVRLAYAEGTVGDAVDALLRAEAIPLVRKTLPGLSVENAVAEVASCADARSASSGPFARFGLTSQSRDVELPAGCYRVRAVAPGHAPSSWIDAGELPGAAHVLEPAAGLLHWHVVDSSGAVSPARLSVRGIPPTPDPDWGDDPHNGAALEAIHTLGEGEIAIPPGKYHVIVTRGFEYSAREETISVRPGATTRLEAKLERVVDTTGWISADLHVHAVPSPDAPTLLEDRVRSLVASGVEVAVATDHNAVTDYGPTIRQLGASSWLASIVGDEVTTRGNELGHFNVFPLVAGGPAVAYADTTPGEIFAAARAADPSATPKVVQVNHPRMGRIGYFELIRFDPKAFDAWRANAPLFDGSFDALEVFNGDEYSDLGRVEAVLRDWYALLDAGIHATATGNSDSHKLTYHEPGVPRNFVRMTDDSPAAFDPHAFVDAVRHGRVTVSNGPFVWLRAHGAEIGDTIAPGEADIEVHVEAPPWVDVRAVELLVHGKVAHTWDVAPSKTPTRLDAKITLPVRSGDYLLAVVRGREPMAYLHRPGALPFAFTNPIRVQ
jgi:hypothetical protein